MMEQVDLAKHLLLFSNELETLVKLNDGFSQDLKNRETELQNTKNLLHNEVLKNKQLLIQLNHYKQLETSKNNPGAASTEDKHVEQAIHSVDTNKKEKEREKELELEMGMLKEKNFDLSNRYSHAKDDLASSLLKIESLEIAYGDLDKSLNERTEGSKQTIARLEKELADRANESHELIDSYHKMKEEYEKIIGQMSAEHTAGNTDLGSQVLLLQQDLDKYKDESAFLTIELQQATRDLEKSKEINRQWKEQLDKAGEENSKIEQLHAEKMAGLEEKMVAEKEKVEEQCKKLKTELEQYGQNREVEIAKRLAESLDKLEHQKNQEVERYKNGAVEIVMLSEQLEKSQKQCEQLQKQLKQLESSYQQMERTKQSQIDDLQDNSDSHETQVDLLKNQIKQMEQQIILLENNHNNNINGSSSSSNDKDSHINENGNGVDGNEQLELVYGELKIKYSSLLNNYAKLSESIEDKDRLIENLDNQYKDTVENLQRSIRDKDIKLGANGNEARQFDERIRALIQISLNSNRRKYSGSQSIFKLSDQRYIINSTPVEITIDENDKLFAKQSGALIPVPLETYFIKTESFFTWDKVLMILLGFFIAFYIAALNTPLSYQQKF